MHTANSEVPTPLLAFLRAQLQEIPELTLLAGTVQATPEATRPAANAHRTAGQVLFGGTSTVEFDRTAMSMYLFHLVLQGAYTQFTHCQPHTEKLREASFQSLQAYTRRTLNDAAAIHAMMVALAIHDLGKVETVIQAVQQDTGYTYNDHDTVLLMGLQHCSDLFPSFARLPEYYQELLLEKLHMDFQVGQYVQAECPAASLPDATTARADVLAFHLLHTLYDIAGAAGHSVQNGSATLTEATYQGVHLAASTLEQLYVGKSKAQVYESYLHRRADLVELHIEHTQQYAVARLLCMLRIFDIQEAERVLAAYAQLPLERREILERELTMTGITDGQAILLYYSPALLLNLQRSLASSHDTRTHILSFTLLTRIYQLVREHIVSIASSPDNGVYTVLLSKLAEDASKPETAKALLEKPLTLVPVGNQLMVDYA